MKDLLKKWVKKIPIAFTLNQQYDQQSEQLIRLWCRAGSSCIDIGCHKGEVLDIMLRYAPQGLHYAFEPIPDMYKALRQKYQSRPCHIFDVALSDKNGETTFNYVVSNPAYSGLLKRRYDRPHEEDTTITVRTARLDDILPATTDIRLMKIDVEGAELLVLKGAEQTIRRCQPLIVFEHGLGASDYYGSTPKAVYELLSSCGLHINTMKNYLNGKAPLSLAAFEKNFYNQLNYYFCAYSAAPPITD
ncbi:MAG: FkbM family methyltransferase [Sphingobacteriales bacterium]|nr:FkbM family methyltransferase [Sphingobacteriales bacterium]